jgi:hypothetical protein
MLWAWLGVKAAEAVQEQLQEPADPMEALEAAAGGS